jgi:AbrB family looped-hinge helix DNA binding protein
MTTLTGKGQVTPKPIREALQLRPGMPVEFAVNAAGEVVIESALRCAPTIDRR